MLASDDKIAPFPTDNYQTLLTKHPQRAKFSILNPKKLYIYFVTDLDLYNAITSFSNEPESGSDKIVLQNFKELVSKSNGSAGLKFLRSLTKLMNLIGVGKTPNTLQTFFFWRTTYRTNEDRRRININCPIRSKSAAHSF